MWTSPDRSSPIDGGPDHSAGPTPTDLQHELQAHAVHALGVLDESPRPELEGIARLAARLCRTPWASINLIDAERQWSAAAHGIRPDSVPRDDSMCARTIDAGFDRIATDDAGNHRLFADSPFVLGPLGHLRTYAAAVIRATDGTPLGSVCVFSEDAVAIDDDQLESLTDLADSARALLELDRRATRLALLATIDPLTEVLNRRGFEDALVRLVSQARREGLRPGALLFDLDGFKSVNDTFGHAAGDELLRLVCGRLVSATRDEDVVARLGGDELAVLVPRTDEASIEVARRRLLDALQVPTSIQGATVTPRASCGAAVWLGDSDEPRAMLDRADLDMYRDKELARQGATSEHGRSR
jgi:diguanylate cyclase (GGDEF)-like protein